MGKSNITDLRLVKQSMPASEPIPTAAFKTRHHRPYFTPAEVAYLSEKQRGRMSESEEDRKRQIAMSFIDLVGVLLGL